MPKIRTPHATFVAGEFSPLLAARSDLAIYRNGGAVVRNMRPLAQGGVTTRPGTTRLATVDVAGARLVPFKFNAAQRYVLMFSDTRMQAFLPDGTACAPITGAPWSAAQVPQLGYAIAGDTIIVLHPDMPTQVIRRVAATTFTLAPLAYETTSTNVLRIPFHRFAVAGITLTPSATTGSITVNASAAHFVPEDVGSRYRIAGKQIAITAYTSPTSVTANVIETLTGTSAQAEWDEQAFSQRRGYPGCAAFADNRLILAASRELPSGFWWSKVGAFFNFDLGTALDNEAVWDAVTGDTQVTIRHVIAAERLLIFGDSGIWFVPKSDQQPLTPKTLAFRQVSEIGADVVRPVRQDGAIVFVDTTRRVVREARYDDGTLSYTTAAVSLASEHLIRTPVAIAAFEGDATRPERFSAFLTADGTLAVFHSIEQEKIAAWFPWDTDGIFEAATAVGSEMFVVVRRTLNGVPVRSLEVFRADQAPLDCARRTAVSVPTRTFTGFAYLANVTVQVVSKGHALGDITVAADGTITLPDALPAVTELEAGLPFEQHLRPMPLDFELPDGPARGLMKRKLRALVQVHESQGFQVDGVVPDALVPLAGDDFASPAPTFTGLVEVPLLGLSREAQCDLVTTKPVRLTVLGLTLEVQLNG